MHKQQYTLFLTRDDGSTRSIRFCSRTLRLIILLCVMVPTTALVALYFVMHLWQDTVILSHKNELLSQEMQVYQQELQKYATIQQLVKNYEHEASPILYASQAVPASVPYALDVEQNVVPNGEAGVEASTEEASTEESSVEPKAEGVTSDVNEHQATASAQQDEDASKTDQVPQNAATTPENVVATNEAVKKTPDANTDGNTNANTDANTNANASAHTDANATLMAQSGLNKAKTGPSHEPNHDPDHDAHAEAILQQNQTDSSNKETYTAITDGKAKLTDITLREQNGTVRATFKLANNTESAIAGHLYISIQGHDNAVHAIPISEKQTAFRIQRFRDYSLTFNLPTGFTVADVKHVIITAKTRDGEVYYCNGFDL